MKRFVLTGFLALAFAPFAEGQPAPQYINNGTIITNIPPQIDAIQFINNGIFDISLNAVQTNKIGAFGSISLDNLAQALDFSDVLVFTNRGTMSCDSGFLFNTEPSGTGTAHRAAIFGQSNLGQVEAGSAVSPITTASLFFLGDLPSLTVSATNVVNTGILDVGVNGLLTLDGENLYLARGVLNIEGLSTFSSLFIGELFFGASFDIGVFPTYWGLGLETNAIPATTFTLSNATTSFHLVTNTLFQPGDVQVAPSNAMGFANVTFGVSNTFTQVVIVGNANTNVSVNVLFDYFGTNAVSNFFEFGFGIPVIQWSSTTTNFAGIVTTNTLYLADGFGAFTNFQIITNGFSQTTSPQLIPFNYTFSQTFPGYNQLNVPNTTYSPGLIPTFSETNQYTAYAVNVGAVTFQPDPTVPGQTVTNVPGRIEINADNYLDLTRTIISGPNYLNLTSTNEFVGATNASIASPFMDINLGTTNGLLSLSNVVAPYIPRLNGPIDAYSARWTNVIGGITNAYHVLFVASDLAPTALPQLMNCTLRSTNVVISDVLNISSNLLVEANAVTINSNAPGSPNLTGQLNIESPNITWTASFPTLEDVTNWGSISFSNTVYFLGARQPPYYSSNFTEPYQSFVNHGVIQGSGLYFWANYFENSGSNEVITNFNFNIITNGPALLSTFGSISIEAETANITNGTFITYFGGDVDLTCGSLAVSNTTMSAYGALNLTVSNAITDTGTNSSNFWLFADGMNFPVLPASGDLLGTTITNTSPGNAQVNELWAGQDRGNSGAGFLNNAALGRLVLDGGNSVSTYLFSGSGPTNAIYIDQIVLENGATNRSVETINGQRQPVFTAIDVTPGMTVYYADAIFTNGVDVSSFLNGTPTASGGNIVWVPSYVGFFSGTNVVTTNSSGVVTTNRVNAGLLALLNPSQIMESSDINLSIHLATNPAPAAVISWQTLNDATNYLFASTNPLGTNWTLVTNFVVDPGVPLDSSVLVNVSVTNNALGGGPRYYKVRVDPPQP